jgi:hypothetical protein
MEIKGDRIIDLHLELSLESPKLADVLTHPQYHLAMNLVAMNLEDRSRLDFFGLALHQSQMEPWMEFFAGIGVEHPANPPNILWELLRFPEAAIPKRLEMS